MILQDMLALLEDKTEHLEKTLGPKILAAAKKEGSKLDNAVDVIKELSKANPNHKHMVWITRMYVAGKFKLEDVPRLKDEIENFERLKNRLEKKDLNAYKSLEELYDALEAAEPSDDEKAKDAMQSLMAEKSKDAEFLIRSKNYMALIPKSQEAACKYGAGTKWCTAAEKNNYFDSYNRRGDLIIIIAKLGDEWRKFQFHFESASFMDERDTPAKKEDIKLLSKFPEHIKLIHLLIDKYHPEDDD